MNKINKKEYNLSWEFPIRFKMAQTSNETGGSTEGTLPGTRTNVTPADISSVEGSGVGVVTASGKKYYSQDDVANIAEKIIQQRVSEITNINNSNLLVAAQGIAKQILNETSARAQLANQLAKNGRVMTRFNVDDMVSNVKTKTSTPMWSDSINPAYLSHYYTSSNQSKTSKQYYIGVYQKDTSSIDSELQFTIAYGNRNGLGSVNTNGDSPSRAIYYQYRNILLNPNDMQFTIGNGNKNTDSIFVLSIARNRLKDKIDPGNWELVISSSNGNPPIHLVDDSNSNTSYTIGPAGRVFNIVSGTIYNLNNVQYYNNMPSTYYGLVYPDMGIFVLDTDILVASASMSINLNTDISTIESATSASVNIMTLFKAMSGSVAYNLLNSTDVGRFSGSFAARNEETVTSTHYFIRIKNSEYNYSNNPTFTTGSLGDLRYMDFIDNPNVYITTVGLYNDNNELLAVAKLSRPLLKNFDIESLIRVRLDF